MIIKYFILLFNTLVCQAGDIIDSGFVNSMGVGVICIMGIIASVKTLFRAFYMYGDYYFRVKGDRAKGVLYFTLAPAFILSVILFIFAGFVPAIYTVEPQYETLLVQCVRITAATFTFEAVMNQLCSYMVYTGQGKLCSIINSVYYIVMIILDIIAVMVFKSVHMVLVFTGICLFSCCLVTYRLCGIYREKYAKGDIECIVKEGFPYFLNSCICKITMVLINVFATRLGTDSYAILVVSRKALEFGQECLSPMQPLSLVHFRGRRPGYRELTGKLNRVLITGSFVFLAVGCITAMVIKGNLSVSSLAVPITVTFLTSLPTYMFFMLGHVKTMLDDRGDIMNHTSFIRLSATLVLCMLSLRYGMWPLLMYSSVVDSLIGTYIYRQLNSGSFMESCMILKTRKEE